jgi:hypothetical protein
MVPAGVLFWAAEARAVIDTIKIKQYFFMMQTFIPVTVAQILANGLNRLTYNFYKTAGYKVLHQYRAV